MLISPILAARAICLSNPTTGNEIFEFELPCNNAEGLLIVSDMTGHTIYSNIVGSGANTITLDTRPWSNGIYLYRLSCNNKAFGTGKFEVIK